MFEARSALLCVRVLRTSTLCEIGDVFKGKVCKAREGMVLKGFGFDCH